jgi:hypothetical protein
MTMDPYPITIQRPLEPAPRRGRLGLGQRRREADELPAAYAHQVLVYRVRGQYILDGGFDPAHEHVVDASHVSVVDMRRDVQVAVWMEIPSAEASEFSIHVTFVCTVTDPVAVVRGGLYEAETTLLGYLKRHHKIAELGLTYRIAEVNDVRRHVNAQVTAYTTLNPPIVPGISVTFGNVEVLTPEELAEFERTRRDLYHDHTLKSELQRFDYTREFDRRRNDQSLQQMDQEHEHNLEFKQSRQGNLIATEDQRGEWFRRNEELELLRRELAKTSESIGGDYRNVLYLAHLRGELTADEMAAQMKTEEIRREGIEQIRWEAERQDRREALAMEREDLIREHQLQREERLGNASITREDEQRTFDNSMQVLREFSQTGHLSMVNVQLDRLVQSLVDKTSGELTGGEARELAEAPDSGADAKAREEEDAEVREEDED